MALRGAEDVHEGLSASAFGDLWAGEIQHFPNGIDQGVQVLRNERDCRNVAGGHHGVTEDLKAKEYRLIVEGLDDGLSR